MNRVCLCFLICIVLLGVIGCGESPTKKMTISIEKEDNETTEFKNGILTENGKEILNLNIIEKTGYYEVFQTNDYLVYCNFFNKKGDLIRQEGPLTKLPRINFVEDTVIKFTVQSGTGIATNWGYYFDINQENFSETFFSIFDEQNGRVVFATADEIVIRDIFSKNQYYKTISNFSKEFSPVAFPFVNVQFERDSNFLTVTYLTGEERVETSETFDLNN